MKTSTILTSLALSMGVITQTYDTQLSPLEGLLEGKTTYQQKRKKNTPPPTTGHVEYTLSTDPESGERTFTWYLALQGGMTMNPIEGSFPKSISMPSSNIS